MANERVIRETRPPRDSNPAVAIVAALLVALLIGLAIYFFNRNDDNGGTITPAPQSSNSQETTAPSSSPSSEPSSAPSATSTP